MRNSKLINPFLPLFLVSLGQDTDIYTHKLFDGYWSPPGFCFGGFCNDPLIITSDATFSNVEERVKVFLHQITQRQSPYYTTRNVMVVMGTRLGYHDANTWFDNIDKLIANVNSRQSNYNKGKVYLFYSTPACYLKAVHSASPKLSTKQDDFFPFTYDKDTHASGMYTSRPVIKYLAREVHHYIQIAKQLQVFAQLGNNDRRFEELMWISGVLQDHTIITGGMRPHVTEYYARKAFLAREICLQIFRPALNILRKSPKEMIYYSCQFNVSSCWTLEGNRFFIVIYNPLSWPVTMPVRLPVTRGIYTIYDPKGVKQNHSVFSIPDLVKSIPHRGDYATEDEIVFIAESIPPLGFKSYYIDRVTIRSRTKRSIIKKLNKNSKKKKYLTRQTNNLKIDDKSLLDDIPEYEYFEDATEKISPSSKLNLVNVSKVKELEMYTDFVFTPPPQKVLEIDEELEAQKIVLQSSSTAAPVPFTTRTTTTTSTSTTASTSTFTTTSTTKRPFTTTTTATTKATTKKTTPNYVEYYDEDTTENIVESTTPYFDFEKYYRRMEKSGYHSMESSDNFIKNEYIQINFNDKRKLLSIALSNGVSISFDIQLCYYVSDDPTKLGTDKKKPGPYIFRPMDPQPLLISDNLEAKVLKSDIVEELQIKFSNYAGVTLRLYKGLPTIELDWIVGPIPVYDDLGKEIFIRYVTDLNNKGVFYTDSNGRQTIKRIREVRPTYTPTIMDAASAVAGNFYPVTSKIYIEDLEKNIRLSIFPDRSQGGTSLLDGNVDLMLHRRIFTDDSGIQAYLNETEFGQGLIVRGTHHLYISKADFRPNKVFEKKFAKELELGPKVFTSIHPSYFNISYDAWKDNTNEYSALRMKVPIGIHVLTVEKWHDKLLIRLENYLEKSDVVRNRVKKVFITDLFRDFRITELKETTLSAHIWLEDYFPLQWQKEKFVKNFNQVYGNISNLVFSEDSGFSDRPFTRVNLDRGIDLKPQQIRTFVASYVRL
ncbi:hypothetical protein B5X24_HaOG214601 [Helicoverpa armigera]|uniref:Alpha-mannosidase n=1 Tax=Helicoverpa armigera TaxID=29058 RepID=A0A2W1BC85_HELAM|nr:hypothetical protein B5X24_HaOG214601 [Helicoverpa armigera]